MVENLTSASSFFLDILVLHDLEIWHQVEIRVFFVISLNKYWEILKNNSVKLTWCVLMDFQNLSHSLDFKCAASTSFKALT